MKIIFSLISKEVKQIIRDPSSIMISFLLPLILMLIFAYGINLDNNTIKVGLLVEDNSSKISSFVESLEHSDYLNTVRFFNRQEMEKALIDKDLKGMIIIPNDFAQKLYDENSTAEVQVITDGSDPNMSLFVENYTNGVIYNWENINLASNGNEKKSLINIQTSTWFNPELKSINFILPTSISVILTNVGILLTALVIAREWERGTMESLLSTKVKRIEFVVAKFLSYYGLSMLSWAFCTFLCCCVFNVPLKGSLLNFFITSSLFVFTSLGQGLLVSSLCHNQFLASISASVVGLLPATMLSGMMFEISSMPKVVQLITYIVPARYYVICVRNLFNAGNMWYIMFNQCLFMIVFSIIMFIIVYRSNKERLE